MTSLSDFDFTSHRFRLLPRARELKQEVRRRCRSRRRDTEVVIPYRRHGRTGEATLRSIRILHRPIKFQSWWLGLHSLRHLLSQGRYYCRLLFACFDSMASLEVMCMRLTSG